MMKELCSVAVLSMAMLGTSLPSAAQTLLSPNNALYARLVRISHASDPSQNGQIVATVTGNGEEDVYTSPDGSNFTYLTSITDSDFAGGICCGTLYELPQAVGGLQAGTLIFATSAGFNGGNQRQIKVYSSGDQGRSWSYLSNIVSSNSGGLWEPQFENASDGALVMIFSDESNGSYSQFLNHARTYDGTTWQDFSPAVASSIYSDRPGMAVVNRLSNGSYFMTFELCGPAACTVFYKTSGDGWNWGSPSDVGSKISTADGQFFEHAPTNAVLPDGSILLVGQVLLNSDGSIASGNGETLFKNSSGDPSQTWTTLPAPVPVPGAYDNYCPNYSSPLLPSPDGSSVLEFADAYSGSNCLMSYASGPTQ